MLSLKQVLPTLRREILTALEEGRDLPAGAELKAERVVLSLAVSLQQKPGNDGSDTLELVVPFTRADRSDSAEMPDTRAPAHTLTIEFRLASAFQPPAQATGQPRREATAQNAGASESPKPDPVFDSLSSIFGAPGFDSSARATVFREALAGISDDQARAIADSLRGLPTPGITPAAARARSLVERLVTSAPAGPARGREVLGEVFHQHSVQSLLRLVRERWRTQEEWLNEPVQRPKSGSGQTNRRHASDL